MNSEDRANESDHPDIKDFIALNDVHDDETEIINKNDDNQEIDHFEIAEMEGSDDDGFS